VQRAYFGLLLALELQSLVREQRGLWQEVESVVRSRYAVGQGAQLDVLRVQVEVTRIEQRAIEQATDIEVRSAELGRLLARPFTVPPNLPRLTVQPLTQALADVIERVRTLSPELAAARLAVDRDRLAVAVAKSTLKPDLSVQAGFMSRGGLDPVWLAGVGLSVPFNRKARTAAIAEANLTMTGSARAGESRDLELRFLTTQRVLRALSLEKTVELYDDGIVLQDRMTLEAAIANYQNGRVPFASVLDAMMTHYTDRWTRAGLILEHENLRLSIDEADLDPGAGMAPVAGPMGSRGAGTTAAGTARGMEGR
jgi:cobalt-zinc-cadmium efflux system outer membrane protein